MITESIFAHGQVYVLWSRITKPSDFHLVGLPPVDLLNEVAAAWKAAGLNVDTCFAHAVNVTNDWQYTPASNNEDATKNVAARLKAKWDHQRRVPLKLRRTKDILRPQPATATVLESILNWIDEQDLASQKPNADKKTSPRAVQNFIEILRAAPKDWWMTEMERRKRPEDQSSDSGEGEDAEHSASDDEVDLPPGEDASFFPDASVSVSASSTQNHEAFYPSAPTSSSFTHKRDAPKTPHKQNAKRSCTAIPKTTSSWRCSLLADAIGLPVSRPAWYMRQDTNAVLS